MTLTVPLRRQCSCRRACSKRWRLCRSSRCAPSTSDPPASQYTSTPQSSQPYNTVLLISYFFFLGVEMAKMFCLPDLPLGHILTPEGSLVNNGLSRFIVENSEKHQCCRLHTYIYWDWFQSIIF